MKVQRLCSEPMTGLTELRQQLFRAGMPLNRESDLDALLESIGDARYVLLGEASHGTAEYYDWRAAISKRLIREKGFSFIAVEGDWPDCYRVNRYVKGVQDSTSSVREVLKAFVRWPTWMWANEEVVTFSEWLQQYNQYFSNRDKVGFYGLDVYSLWDSLYAILRYLRQLHPALLTVAHQALRCFQPYGEDVQQYARATVLVPESCEDEVVSLLTDLRVHQPKHFADEREDSFVAEQNAHVVKNAEAYYRAMVRGGPQSWNIRDRHMTETLERLMRHHGPNAKAIVWEHNTHVGDARYTDMSAEGMFNVGQLVRQRHFEDGVFILGFGSYRGRVVAARDWEAPIEHMRVPPAREGSSEDIFHQAGGCNRLLIMGDCRADPRWNALRGHRAIGVLYHPEYDDPGNYVPTNLVRRYDAFCYFEETHALHPLHTHPAFEKIPETFPWGT